jgi:hypothetical protein
MYRSNFKANLDSTLCSVWQYFCHRLKERAQFPSYHSILLISVLAKLPYVLSGKFPQQLFFVYITQSWRRKHQFRLRLVNEIRRSVRRIVSIPSTNNVIDIRKQDALSGMEVCNMSLYTVFSGRKHPTIPTCPFGFHISSIIKI